MTAKLAMFPDVGRKVEDICAGRHGNQARSVEANPAKLTKEEWRARILELVRAQGAHGLTLDEAAIALHVEPNRISGRFSELGADGLLTRKQELRDGLPESVTRRTRLGRPADVWIVKGGSHA